MALVDGYREKDRMLRNDLMVLLSILTRRPEARAAGAGFFVSESVVFLGIFIESVVFLGIL